MEYDGGLPHSDIVDKFTITMSQIALHLNELNPLPVSGQYGVESLTVTFHNITINPSSHSSEGIPAFTTKSHLYTGIIT